ncbi:hypothetical protein U2I54_23665, partial [Bacillus pseudomycoides]|nr:hypothetical protein [Bacillus pseudomycoides]
TLVDITRHGAARGSDRIFARPDALSCLKRFYIVFSTCMYIEEWFYNKIVDSIYLKFLIC